MPITELDNLAWLAHWYRAQCDGTWENTRGLCLEPHIRSGPDLAEGLTREPGTLAATAHGWQLTIALPLTDGHEARTRSFLLETSDGGWVACSLTPDCFVGRGDADKVEQIIGVFRRWIEQREWDRDEGGDEDGDAFANAVSVELAPGSLELVSSPSR